MRPSEAQSLVARGRTAADQPDLANPERPAVICLGGLENAANDWRRVQPAIGQVTDGMRLIVRPDWPLPTNFV